MNFDINKLKNFINTYIYKNDPDATNAYIQKNIKLLEVLDYNAISDNVLNDYMSWNREMTLQGIFTNKIIWRFNWHIIYQYSKKDNSYFFVYQNDDKEILHNYLIPQYTYYLIKYLRRRNKKYE